MESDNTERYGIIKKSVTFLMIILFFLTGFSTVSTSLIQKQSTVIKKNDFSFNSFIYKEKYDYICFIYDILNYLHRNNSFLPQLDYIRQQYADKYNNLRSLEFKRQQIIVDNETWDIIVPDDYPTIQDAINHAYPYSRIYVRSGIYNEQIVIDVQALYIVGQDMFTTVILGKENKMTVEIRSFLVTITGFNISNGNIGLGFSGLLPTFNTISGNTFFRNNIGIQIGSIERSTLIYHNNFIQNKLNAIDEYENSLWYDSDIKQGNFWDDYTGFDIDGNGIGDTPYEIPGNHTRDFYPLMKVYCGNCSPYQPSKPIGILEGYINNNYSYSSTTSDPRGLDLYYWFEWGDGNNSGWIGPISSGLSCNTSYSWHQKGNYDIRVRVKNSVGTLSIWSDPLTVSMPKNMIFRIKFCLLWRS